MKEQELIRNKVFQLVDLALKINSETFYCVFLSFSGHVDWVEVSIRESKAKYSNVLYPTGKDCSKTIYFPSGNVSMEDFIEQADETILGMKEFI